MVGAARGYHGQAVPAGQREPRAQADSAGARRRAGADRSARRHRRRDPRSAPDVRRGSRSVLLSRPVQQRRATGARTTTRPAPEIIEQTSGRLTHFVAGLGTSGTFVGTGRRLRQFNPAIKLISFQPDSPFHGLEGLKHMESAIVPAIYDPSLADEDLRVEHRDAPTTWCGGSRARKGCWSGISSGAALAATLDVARRLEQRRRRHGLSRRRREIPERSRSGRPMNERRVRRRSTRAWRRRSAVTARKRFRTNAAARSSATATAVSPRRCRCRTRPKKDRGAGFSCGRPTTGWRSSARRELGGELLGFYHSHPDHPARPSQFDLDHAWPTSPT